MFPMWEKQSQKYSGDDMKKVVKSVVFAGILVGITFFLQAVLVPKWESDGKWEPVTNIVDGFYDEEKNSMDVIYLGSSNAFYDINPLVIWEEYGITGYVLGSGEQRIAGSYYYLQEALKTQKPQVVVLDCLSMFAVGSPGEEQNRKAYDYMKLSKEKLESLQEIIGEEESLASYIFPIVRYHGRIWELTGRDFTYLFDDKHYPLKGYAYSEEIVEGLPELNMDVVRHEGISIDAWNKEYLEKIKTLCEEEGIKLILIKTPNIEWGIYEHTLMTEYAKELALPFYDYNTFYKELGISVEDCFLDGAHLNYKGAEKLSSHLGDIVSKECVRIGGHDEKIYEQWKKDLAAYRNK